MAFTLILVIAVFYNVYKKQVIDDLKMYARIIIDIDDIDNCEIDNGGFIDDYGIRVTLIKRDGTVIYDNMADIATMENHGDRPEVVEAFEQGEGQYVRISETFDKNTYYYAVKASEDIVLRVSKDAGGIIMIFASAVPALCVVVLVMSIVCICVAGLVTRKLMEPIVKASNNIELIDENQIYEEMAPLVHTIKQQHHDIISNANMRQEFTANVSHELKTPLTSITGYAELIENGMADEQDTKRFATEIRKNAKRLLTLINDIMKLSELDDTNVRKDFAKVDLYEAAKECVDMLEMSSREHEVTVSLFGTSCIVDGNKRMLEELVYNLCDNAIRYNNKGGMVNVMVKEEDGHCILSVKDNGIGISAENQERIFERFYRVDKSRSKATGGTGLGLAIVKHIVLCHDASIEVKSALNMGTEIKVTF